MKDLLKRQLAIQCVVEPGLCLDIPSVVEYFQNIVPLEKTRPLTMNQSERTFPNYTTTVYKAISVRDGMPYCLRRIHSK